MTNNIYNQISALWNEFYHLPFPQSAINKNFDLGSIDTFAAGIIQSYVTSKGKISKKHLSILVNLDNDLKNFMQVLDNHELIYFNKLHNMCSLIIDCHKK